MAPRWLRPPVDEGASARRRASGRETSQERALRKTTAKVIKDLYQAAGRDPERIVARVEGTGFRAAF